MTDYKDDQFCFMQGDCIERMKEISDGSVDMVLTDLPYGTTACKWDTAIDFEQMWNEVNRIMNNNGAMVFTASQPFTSKLIMSKPEWFKYTWVWAKNRPTGHAHAKNKPLKKHEDIVVFSKGTTVHASQSANRMPYYPQGVYDIEPVERDHMGKNTSDTHFSSRPSHRKIVTTKSGYPNTILEFSIEMKRIHPTAKPLALMEYLIKTYTQEGDTVLDFTMGSGTTGVACKNLNRNFIGIELDEGYFEAAKSRVLHNFSEKTKSKD